MFHNPIGGFREAERRIIIMKVVTSFNTSMLLLILEQGMWISHVSQFQYIHVTINPILDTAIYPVLLFQYIHVTINQ